MLSLIKNQGMLERDDNHVEKYREIPWRQNNGEKLYLLC